MTFYQIMNNSEDKIKVTVGNKKFILKRREKINSKTLPSTIDERLHIIEFSEDGQKVIKNNVKCITLEDELMGRTGTIEKQEKITEMKGIINKKGE